MAGLGKLAQAIQLDYQPKPLLDITIATVFGQSYTVRVLRLCLWEALCKAMAWLCKVANLDQELPCLAD